MALPLNNKYDRALETTVSGSIGTIDRKVSRDRRYRIGTLTNRAIGFTASYDFSDGAGG